MHDNSIERTTNGTGMVKDLTYAGLQQYFLKDDYGNVTSFKIPLFSEVLEWCKTSNVILTVDIKRSVSLAKVIKAIERANAERISVIITYDLQQAKSAYGLNPNLMLSVSARNDQELQWLLNSGIPTQNMVAFTGTRLSDRSLYNDLKANGIVCMLGTLGNLDNRAEARGDNLYMDWMDLGIDILATDRPFEAHNAIKE
jgi:glycerophosphoryl diester phosphodiesterase